MKNKYIHSHSIMKDRGRILRNNPTPQEYRLWQYLKNRKLGYKFQRQHSIGNYIVDFYCASQKLIIELDGPHHLDKPEYDKERTCFLENAGFKVIRFWNIHVDTNIEEVLVIIKSHCK